MSIPVSPARYRRAISSRRISDEKRNTGPRRPTFTVSAIAKAVLPIEGRPPTTTSEPGWRPAVSSSSAENPVGSVASVLPVSTRSKVAFASSRTA